MPSREVPENQREPFLQFIYISSIFVRNNALILGWCAQHKSSRNCQGGGCANDPKRIPYQETSIPDVMFCSKFQDNCSFIHQTCKKRIVNGTLFSPQQLHTQVIPGLSLAFQILCFVRSVPFFATMSCFRFPGRHVRPLSRIGAEAHAEFLSGTAA